MNKKKLSRSEKRINNVRKRLDEDSLRKYDHMVEKHKANEEKFRKDLIGHLSALNDGVIAIFITVMMLSIPYPTTTGEYKDFIWAILVFLVSFFTLAEFWYDSKRTFGLVREADHRFVVANFLFLAALALLPITTSWIMLEQSRVAAINFGVVFLLAALMGEVMYYIAMRKRFEHHMKLFIRLIIGRTGPVLAIDGFLIILACFKPRWAIMLYIIMPVMNFFAPRDNEN